METIKEKIERRQIERYIRKVKEKEIKHRITVAVASIMVFSIVMYTILALLR